MTARGPLIAVQDLGLTLGRTEVLTGVNLTVAAGSIHALVGPNGGGKSSLIRCLLGQMPHRGTVALNWPDRPGRIGYVPQALQFDAGLPMTVGDFLSTMDSNRPGFLRPRRATRDQIEAQLDRVGMAGKSSRRMGALSGGERQRVLMAQALEPAPDLLILDEPMSALDESGGAIFADVMQSLRRDGVTVLWIEHDLLAVRRLADRVTGLARRVIFDGAPDAMLEADRVLDLFSQRSAVA